MSASHQPANPVPQAAAASAHAIPETPASSHAAKPTMEEQPVDTAAIQAPFPDKGPAIATLVSIEKDGSDGQRFPLSDGVTDIGRLEGDITLEADPYLAPRHARLRTEGGRFILSGLDDVNGVFVRLREPCKLVDGDVLLIGQQVLRYDLLPNAEMPLGPAATRGVMVFGTPEVPYFARLSQYTTEGISRDVYYLYRDETVIGRENGDMLFTDDPFLSRRHASIRRSRRATGPGEPVTDEVTLTDLSSANGTAVRVRGDHVLRPGDQFRAGRHLFRFDEGAA